MIEFILSYAHDWRYIGDGWRWLPNDGSHPELTGWDRPIRKCYTNRECMSCGQKDTAPFGPEGKCKPHWEEPGSGWGGRVFKFGQAR